MSKTKDKRPKIPATVQLKLWINSGGRCQLCNKPVYIDGYTLKEGNWSNIAHIVAWTPDGPRGDAKLSPSLATEYSNLMLMCNTHAHLIDTKESVKEYSVQRLRQIKAEHEKRIKILTSIRNTAKTHALVIQTNIGDCTVETNYDEILLAITKNRMYPSEEHPFVIDLTGDNGRGDVSFYTGKAKEISNRLKAFFDKFNALSSKQHISIFPFGLMPLLVHFGKELGDKHTYQLFQHHRGGGGWAWPNLESSDSYLIKKPEKVELGKEVYLLISLSDKIGKDKLKTIPTLNNNIYEITIENPNRGFLVNPNQLVSFGAIYRQLLNEIETTHGIDATINLLLAAPCPIAVQCGQALIPTKDSKIVVYDFNIKQGGFFKALTV